MTALITATVIGVAGSAAISGSASRSASRTQQAGTDATIREQRRQYDTTRSDFAPWRESGQGALNRLDRASTGDMSDFQASPGYNFRLNEGTRNLENRFSTGGGGGNAMRALTEYGQNFASNEFGNWWDRQSGLAGVGQAATGSTAQFGANAANNISNAYMKNANNQSSIGMWNAGNMNNALQTGLSNYLYQQKPPPPQIQPIGRGN